MGKRILNLSREWWKDENEAARLEWDDEHFEIVDGPEPERKPKPAIDDEDDLLIV